MPELETATAPAEVGAPFLCPKCGADAWHADYYEAVWQTATVLVGEEGEPDVVDYDGCTGTYDDPSTDNERIVCSACRYEIVLGVFRLVTEEARQQHRALASRLDELVAAFREGNSVEDVLATLEAAAEALRLDAGVALLPSE